LLKKNVRDIDVSGKKVLVRVDFNVPIERGVVVDDTRIRAALPTIRYLLEHQASVILVSHMGRPKGKVVDELRLDPVAQKLADILRVDVFKIDEVVGHQAEAAAAKLKPGQILLLENVRFDEREEKNDPQFAKQLASLADIYVNDAFGTAHRAHASTEGVAHLLPAVAGFLLLTEVERLSEALENPSRPFVSIIGGAKIKDKIGVIDNLLKKVDHLLIGGGLANTFLKAKGYNLGASLVEEEKVPLAADLLGKAKQLKVNFQIPVDVVVADQFAVTAKHRVVPADQVPPGWMVLDIGPQTVKRYREIINKASFVVWNGPMGVFELDPFARGTFQVAEAVAECSGTTIIGGGDSVAAIEKAGLVERVTHISTGGGASG
jgi:phosphoglycerate kinase